MHIFDRLTEQMVRFEARGETPPRVLHLDDAEWDEFIAAARLACVYPNEGAPASEPMFRGAVVRRISALPR